MIKDEVIGVLKSVIHPETGVDIVSGGIVENISVGDDKLTLTLSFAKSRDPFAQSIKRHAQAALETAFPKFKGNITIIIKEAAPQKPEQKEKFSSTGGVKKIIAVASGKGGVGKSTVTANLAVTLKSMGYKVGILDADIYGPSQPKMFGVEGFQPEAIQEEGRDLIIPAFSLGVKIMSIGFFINSTDALVWRGAMATNALRQLIHQTLWGELDYLLIDLPPGTGDVHLTVIQELKIDGAVIVSTPQQIAVADVLRGIKMFQAEKIEIPVLGIIENMAWFTPEELPNNKYYIFGRGGAEELAKQEGIELVGKIPIVQSVMDGGESGSPASLNNYTIAEHYKSVAHKIVDKLSKGC